MKVYGHPFYFGVPDRPPVIRGFKIHAAPADWLMARQGIKEFFVQILPGSYRLIPKVNGRARTDQCISIPIEL